MPLLLLDVLIWVLVICIYLLRLTDELQQAGFAIKLYLRRFFTKPLLIFLVLETVIFAAILIALFMPAQEGTDDGFVTALLSLILNGAFGVICLITLIFLFKAIKLADTSRKELRIYGIALFLSILVPLVFYGIWTAFNKDSLYYFHSIPLEIMFFEIYVGGALSALIVPLAVPVAGMIENSFNSSVVDTFLRDQRQ